MARWFQCFRKSLQNVGFLYLLLHSGMTGLSDFPPPVPIIGYLDKNAFQAAHRVENSNEIIGVNIDNTQYKFFHWDFVTGQVKSIETDGLLNPSRYVKTKMGYFYIGLYGKPFSRDSDLENIVAFVTGNKTEIAHITENRFYTRNLAVLSDQSLLLVVKLFGQKSEKDLVFRVAVENGKLVSERMPDLPFNPDRYGYSMVGLADGRAMVLGGQDSSYRGCSPCVNETYFLNFDHKKWSRGPDMLQRRANASATLLPNGSVLVVGGYTPPKGGEWGTTSPSTEIWDSKQNQFIQATDLLSGVTMHQVEWLAGQEGKQLLVVGPANVQIYDVEKNRVQFIETLFPGQGLHERPKVFGSFQYGDRYYIWFQDYEGPQPPLSRWHLTEVKLFQDDIPPIYQLDTQNGFFSHLGGYRFYPGEADQPSYMIVDGLNFTRAIWPNGKTQITVGSSTAGLERSQLGLNDMPAWRWPEWTSAVENRTLKDGRIILAGGNIRANKIALLEENGLQSIAADHYIGIGEFTPAHTYAIYEPATKQWRESTPSQIGGHYTYILSDGRVVMMGSPYASSEKAAYGQATKPRIVQAIEISDSEGTSWHNITQESPPDIILDDDNIFLRFFIIQDELFLAGRHLVKRDDDGRISTTDMTQWFNQVSHKWETVWETPPNANNLFDSESAGLIVFRTLANGKKVVFPAYGFRNE